MQRMEFQETQLLTKISSREKNRYEGQGNNKRNSGIKLFQTEETRSFILKVS